MAFGNGDVSQEMSRMNLTSQGVSGLQCSCDLKQYAGLVIINVNSGIPYSTERRNADVFSIIDSAKTFIVQHFQKINMKCSE